MGTRIKHSTCSKPRFAERQNCRALERGFGLLERQDGLESDSFPRTEF
jgi:hypothetical protein